MLRPVFQIRLGLVVVLALAGSAHLFALADEITRVSVNNTSIQVEMMGTKPVFTTDRFTSRGEVYFLLSFSHSVLLGSPRQRFVLPDQSATITAAQYSDYPHIVHVLVHGQTMTSFSVATRRQANAHYRITVAMRGRSSPKS